MKIYRLVLFCILFSANSWAQSIKSEDLERLCTSNIDSERITCTLIVKAYMDGFLDGVAKGVIDTYKYDAQVLEAVKNVKMQDMMPRINKVVEASTCLQRVSVSEMTKTYIDFVHKNPSITQENYRKAMTRAIISEYCRK